MTRLDNSVRCRCTFSEICAESRLQANRTLFARATTASRLAKRATGRARQLLYGIKNRCLWHLVDRGQVLVGVDHDRAPGLLTVCLPGGGRLHTHENWLAAAAEQAA